MQVGGWKSNENILVVAEIGNNHEGSFTLAQELVGRAAESGVGAVKFQTFIPEYYVSSEDQARMGRLNQFRLSENEFEMLAKQAQDLGITFFSTPFDVNSAEFLNTIQPVFKISSGDNNFFQLIRKVASFQKPIIVSTGLADFSLLHRVRKEINDIWEEFNVKPGLAFLHCVSSYPVPIGEINLKAIVALQSEFDKVVVGYSDHSLGIQAAVCSVAMGARIVEKHFTIDKNYSDFRDHQLSLDPEEMRQLVDAILEVNVMLGDGRKVVSDCELDSITLSRRSLAAARDLTCGEILTATDVIWVRPGTGITCEHEECFLGLRIKNNIVKGGLILDSDME